MIKTESLKFSYDGKKYFDLSQMEHSMTEMQKAKQADNNNDASKIYWVWIMHYYFHKKFEKQIL